MTTGPAGVVDSHTHLLPERLAAAIRAFFATHLGHVDWEYPTDPGEVCERLAAGGVAEAWTLPYAHKPGVAAGLNRAVADIAGGQAGGPVHVLAGATVHPGDDDPGGLVRQAVEGLGARVLKLHCSVGDFAPDDPRLDPVWGYASAAAVPTVVHAGHAISGHTDADELAPIATVAERWPDATIIIAHCGHRAAATALDLLRRHPGLHVDLTPVVEETVTVDPVALAAVGTKVLFGSDAPNTFLPVRRTLAAVASLGLAPEIADAVTGGNARRLQAQVRG